MPSWILYRLLRSLLRRGARTTVPGASTGSAIPLNPDEDISLDELREYFEKTEAPGAAFGCGPVLRYVPDQFEEGYYGAVDEEACWNG